jgi:hypothetical protein
MVLDANDTPSSSSTSSSSSLPSSTSAPNSSSASENSSNKGLAVTLGVVCSVFGLLVIGGIWWFIRRGRRRGVDYDPQIFNDNNHSPQMSDTNTNTPAYYYSSRSTSSSGRDPRFRSIPTDIAPVTNTRRTSTRPASSTNRHSTITPSLKLKNPLTTIPEALLETSLARRTSKSPVQDRRPDSLSSPSSSHIKDEREEAWTYPQSVIPVT